MSEEDITQTEAFQSALTEAKEGLDKKNRELLDKLSETKKSLKAYDGIDPDEYGALKEAQERAESEKAKAAGDWEKREGTWKKKVAEKDAIIADQDTRFRDALKERDAALAIGHHGGNEKLLLDTTLKALNVDDEYNVFAEVNGERLPAEKYVAALKEDPDYAGAFPGAGTAGSGAKGSRAGGGTQKVEIPEGITILKSATER